MLLIDDEKLAQICIRLKDEGGQVFCSGGLVRDFMLGKTNKSQDVDLEVFKLLPEQIIEVLKKFSEVKVVGKNYPIIKLKGYNQWDFTFPANPYASYQEACGRRDFTINSILIDVFSNQVVDYYNGQRDLKLRIIRHTNSDVFRIDPIRVYRAAELAARLWFKVENETLLLMKQADLSEIEAERIYRELRKLLLLPEEPSYGLRILEICGVLKKNHPRLNALRGCVQSPVNHPEGDVWEHTLQVVDQAAALKSKSKNPEIFMLAALLHDIGKPLVTRELDGKVTAYGHDVKGAGLAVDFLKELKASQKVITGVSELVREHMIPVLFFKQKDNISDRAIRKLVNRVNVEELLLLSQADYNGRGKIRDYEPIKNWLVSRINELGLKINQRIEPVIKGRDLIELGFKPGPGMKKVLQKAFALQMDGMSRENILKIIGENRS